MSLLDPSRGRAGAQGSAEGRTRSFWAGMHSFAEDPLFGAGLNSWKAKTGHTTHNLYNQALGELGILGLAVLVGFAWAFFGNFLEARHLRGDPHELDALFLYRLCVAAALFCSVLFLLGGGHDSLARYNLLWVGAFSGIALQFLKYRAQAQLLTESDAEGAPLLGCCPSATGASERDPTSEPAPTGQFQES